MRKMLWTILTLGCLTGCQHAAAPPPAAAATPRAAAAVAATPAPAAAEEVSLKDAGFKYTIPSGWKKQRDGQMLLSADESLCVLFIQPPDEEDPKVILQKLDKVLAAQIQEMKVDDQATDHEINGMESSTVSGTGKASGRPVEWSVEVLKVKKPVIILEIAEKGAYEKNQTTYSTFESSFEALAD